MAKRSAKDPNQPADVPPQKFQIPEVEPKIPNPADSIAISLPGKPGVNPDGKAPKPSPKADFNPDNATRPKANVLAPTLTINRPAQGRFSVTATDLLGDCAIANGLGNRTPVKVTVSFSDDNRWCFMMPVHHTSDKALEVTYTKGQAYVNFWLPFEGINKIVQKGYREVYDVWMTDEEVPIHGVFGYALYFSMEKFKEETVSPRDGDAVPAEPSTKTTSGKAKTAKKESETPDSTDEPEDSDDETVTQDDFLLMAQVLREKDAQIKQLQEQLEALKPKTDEKKTGES